MALTGYRVTRLAAAHVPVGTTVNLTLQTVETEVVTSSMSEDHVFATVTGLEAGALYHFAVQGLNAGGGGAAARITVRPFAPASGPENFTIAMANSNATELSWTAPKDLGLSSGLAVSGYEVVAILPAGAEWGDVGSYTVPVGTTADLRTSHALDKSTVAAMEGSVLTYGVYALVQQDLVFGGGIVRSAVAVSMLQVGRIPQWLPDTPRDGTLVFAWIGQTVTIPLTVTDPDMLSSNETINFRLLGAAPPESSLGTMDNAGVMQTNTTASTSLIIRGTRPLVGSDYKVCVLASDSSNLTTPTRCYSIQLPRPRPMIMAPPNKEAYTTAVGCPLVIPMLAQDRTNFDLDPAISLANGYGVLIQVALRYLAAKFVQDCC